MSNGWTKGRKPWRSEPWRREEYTADVDASFALTRTDYDLPRSDQDAYGYYIQSILGSPLTVRDNTADALLGTGHPTPCSSSSITPQMFRGTSPASVSEWVMWPGRHDGRRYRCLKTACRHCAAT